MKPSDRLRRLRLIRNNVADVRNSKLELMRSGSSKQVIVRMTAGQLRQLRGAICLLWAMADDKAIGEDHSVGITMPDQWEQMANTSLDLLLVLMEGEDEIETGTDDVG